MTFNPKLFAVNAAKHPRTSAGGLGVILIAIGNALQSYRTGQPIDFTVLGTALAIGYGLLCAGDSAAPAAVAIPVPVASSSPAPMSPPPAAGGYIGLRWAIASAFVLAIVAGVAGCAALQASSVSGTVSGKSANVTITAPDATPYVLTVADHQECLSTTRFFQVPGSNMECQGQCAQLVPGGATVTVMCRIIGSTAVFPLQFAVPFSRGG